MRLLEHSRIVLISHQSRPGKKDNTTLEAHAKLAAEILGREVTYENDLFSSCARML